MKFQFSLKDQFEAPLSPKLKDQFDLGDKVIKIISAYSMRPHCNKVSWYCSLFTKKCERTRKPLKNYEHSKYYISVKEELGFAIISVTKQRKHSTDKKYSQWRTTNTCFCNYSNEERRIKKLKKIKATDHNSKMITPLLNIAANSITLYLLSWK